MSHQDPQLYPIDHMKVGAVLYSCFAWTDDSGKTTTEINEWVVRSIQARRGTKTRMGFRMSFVEHTLQYVNLTEKIDRLTWGKRSTKNGDYGWLKSIPRHCKKQFTVGSPLPYGIYTEVRDAVLYQLSVTEDYLEECRADGDESEIASTQAEQAALKRRLSALTEVQPPTKRAKA